MFCIYIVMKTTGLSEGSRVGKYIMKRRIGAGAMGEVFEAEHELTAERVAIKILTIEVNDSEIWLERFHREARAASKIGHPGIAQVHDAGFDETLGRYYLAMEFLEGETLSSRVAADGMTLGSSLLMVFELLDALSAAHQASIIHRDVKPENIFIQRLPDGSEKVKLLDFGIAKEQDRPSATSADSSIGTPYYMSPEQARASVDVSAQSDLWSVGVILYWLVEGRPPFIGESSYDIVMKACATNHAPMAKAKDLPPELVSLIEKCLQKRADERPVSAESMREVLHSVLSGSGSWKKLANTKIDLEYLFSPPKPSSTGSEQSVARRPSSALAKPVFSFNPASHSARRPPFASTNGSQVMNDWIAFAALKQRQRRMGLIGAGSLAAAMLVLSLMVPNTDDKAVALDLKSPEPVKIQNTPSTRVKPAVIEFGAAEPAKVRSKARGTKPQLAPPEKKDERVRMKVRKQPVTPKPSLKAITSRNSPVPVLAADKDASVAETEPSKKEDLDTLAPSVVAENDSAETSPVREPQVEEPAPKPEPRSAVKPLAQAAKSPVDSSVPERDAAAGERDETKEQEEFFSF